ncbi:MAG: Gfo/Idh/MocA family protein [Promethearchaeota archaeon]
MLRIGVCGFGFMGKTHCESIIRHPGAKLVAVCSKMDDKNEIEKIGAKYHEDWETLLDCEELDAVIIATPTFTHAELSIQAISRGLHVFLEKPMEINLEKCRDILDASEKQGVKLGMGHVLRFDPQYISIKNQVESGVVGEPKMVRCTRRGAAPSWSNWFFDESKSGTVILDLSIHDIDYTCWIAGKIPSRVAAVASPLNSHEGSIFGVSHVTLEFDGGPSGDASGIELGFCEASWAAKDSFPFSTSVEVSGKVGLLKCEIPGKHALETFSRDSMAYQNVYDESPYFAEVADFIEAINLDRAPKVSGDEGMATVKICLAALESAKTSKIIKLEAMK